MGIVTFPKRMLYVGDRCGDYIGAIDLPASRQLHAASVTTKDCLDPLAGAYILDNELVLPTIRERVHVPRHGPGLLRELRNIHVLRSLLLFHRTGWAKCGR